MRTFVITWKYRDETRHNYAYVKAYSSSDAVNRFDPGHIEEVLHVDNC